MNETERQIVAWLLLPRSARSASICLRISLALLALFHLNTLCEWMNESVADAIKLGKHRDKQDNE